MALATFCFLFSSLTWLNIHNSGKQFFNYTVVIWSENGLVVTGNLNDDKVLLSFSLRLIIIHKYIYVYVAQQQEKGVLKHVRETRNH